MVWCAVYSTRRERLFDALGTTSRHTHTHTNKRVGLLLWLYLGSGVDNDKAKLVSNIILTVQKVIRVVPVVCAIRWPSTTDRERLVFRQVFASVIPIKYIISVRLDTVSVSGSRNFRFCLFLMGSHRMQATSGVMNLMMCPFYALDSHTHTHEECVSRICRLRLSREHFIVFLCGFLCANVLFWYVLSCVCVCLCALYTQVHYIVDRMDPTSLLS